MMVLNPNVIVQLISCTLACVGFAYWFNVKGIQVFYAGIGAFCTWGIYVVAFNHNQSNFLSTMIAAIFVAGYAQIMARVNKAPATIFLSVCSFPLIPGPNLYYTMYGIVRENSKLATTEANTLLLTCLGIVFGFMLVEIVNRYLGVLWRFLHKKPLKDEHSGR